jgi:manganese efflux pump family protein
VLALLLLALALGLDNLAAAIGFGVGSAGGVGGAMRVRIAVVFGLFEAGMPVLGLLLGHGVADSIGQAARWLGGGVLIVFGVAGLVRAWRGASGGARDAERVKARGIGRLLLGGLVLSGDNLAAGFALGSYHAGLLLAAVVFGVVSVAMSLAGLEFGARIGRRAGERGPLIGGMIVVAVGVAVGFGALG